ncbi:hypothetical protein FRB97_009276 [Tulasnella sp. 331]|nr:hypothetical protein FRB97_009276 [Tulasnella sp. 331]
MSYTATATSTTTNATTNPMSSPYYQGHPQQGSQGQQGQQPSPNGSVQPSPYPGVGFPQQPFNPQQQQFAQWAYQQMMFQQQQLGFQPQVPVAPAPYMTAQQQQALQLQLFQQQQQQQFLMQQQQQFPQPPNAPYARENNGSKTSVSSERGGSRSRTNSASDVGKSRARTTSGKSSKAPPSSHNRTPNGSESGGRSRSASGRDASPAPNPTQPSHRLRVSSTSSGSTAPVSASGAVQPSRPSAGSHASSGSNGSLPSPATSSTSSAASTASVKGARPAVKPSPLSQGTQSSNTAARPAAKETQPTPAAVPRGSYAKAVVGEVPVGKSGGLKGRLRRALSFSALDEAGKPEDDKLGSRRQVVNAKLATEGQQPSPLPRSSTSHNPSPSDASSSSQISSPATHVPTEGSIRSTATTAQQAPKKRSLFNSKFNRSTDNMSMSSTVSSASMMIRKLGSVGKLVRRNSLMGISNMFKDKKDRDRVESDGEEPAANGKKDKKDKGKKLLKSGKAEASVSHATVELERGTYSPSSPGGSPSSPQDDMVGLSPAAKLARQHTLRSKAAEAAKTSASLGKVDEVANDGTPSTWDKNTATRSTLSPGAQRKPIGEFGGPRSQQQQTWAEDLSDEETTIDDHRPGQQPPQLGWRDPATVDEDSDEEEQDDEAYDEEDDTVRMSGEVDPMDEPWAVGVRRSVERTRVPAKGILKTDATSYEQSNHLDGPPQAPFTRLRTNSNDSAPPMGAEPGPLARIPSPDPDHIDGLHRSDSGSVRHTANHHRSLSTSSGSSNPGSSLLPPLSFDSGDTSSLSSFLISGSTAKERPNSVYSNADFNASAPALGTHNIEQTSLQPEGHRPHGGMPNLSALRSVTAPLAKSKKLTYAANLSVYHTFSPVAYDRRSEPATCNRLTPALAQRIKEELNSYKMEEMEVHPSSRQQ